MKETREETYRKVFIKTEADFPKENGLYFCVDQNRHYIGERSFDKADKINLHIWSGVDWYLQPVTDKEATGEQEKRPEIVCICGSGRFLMQMHEVEERLTLEGKIVLMIGVNTKDVARTENLEHYKPMLDELHLRKIDISDKVFVVNVGGYIGESTRKEIVYSESHKKSIEYLERETQGKVPHFDIEGGGGVTANEIEQEKQTTESLQYIKKIETLIGLGDTINIKARLIHLKRMIEDDLQAMEKYASQSQSLPSVTRQYPALCSACNGTGSNFSQIDMMNTSSVCRVCNGEGIITVTEYFKSQLKQGYPKEFVEWIAMKINNQQMSVTFQKKYSFAGNDYTFDELFTYYKSL